jgi:NDP-sugar pyrophosphorylase family protein
MPTLFERLKEINKRTAAYPIHEPWLDVGKQEDLIRAISEKEKNK